MRPSTSLLLLPLLYASVEAGSASSSSPASSSQANATVANAGVGPIVGNATSTSSATATSSSSSSAASTSVVNTGENLFIPTSLSASCQSVLESINGDASLSSCTAPLISSLSLFLPSSTETTFAQSSSDVSSTLDKFCSTDKCPDSLIRSTLSQIAKGCSVELQAGNSDVVTFYDTLYVLSPLTAAICSTDSTGNSCLLGIVSGSVAASTSSNTSSPSTNQTISTRATTFDITQYISDAVELASPQSFFHSLAAGSSRLFRRGSPKSTLDTNSTVSANTTNTTYNSTISPPVVDTNPVTLTGVVPTSEAMVEIGLTFMFLNVSMSSAMLCTSCTKNIFAAYVAQEIAMPYALGLGGSPLLAHQSETWTGLGVTCGSGFLSAIATMAGQTTVSTGAGVSLKSLSAVALAVIVGSVGVLLA